MLWVTRDIFYFWKTQIQMDLKSAKHEILFTSYRLLKIWNLVDLACHKCKPVG